jgi:hypothetical protein
MKHTNGCKRSAPMIGGAGRVASQYFVHLHERGQEAGSGRVKVPECENLQTASTY